MSDTRIYIMTHKQFVSPGLSGYYPLHVGKEGKEDLGYPGDDTGNHISGKNSEFCELTGLYWVWKNISCDIAGLCHYRRYFVNRELMNADIPVTDKILTKEYVESVIEEYDMIVPNSAMTQFSSVREQYGQKHYLKDILLCGDIIREKYASDFPAYEWSLDSNFVSLGNMVIARKEVLNAYCSWLFDILFEAENQIDLKEYDPYQKRVMGFLAERLFRVYLLSHPLKIKEEQTIFVQ